MLIQLLQQPCLIRLECIAVEALDISWKFERAGRHSLRAMPERGRVRLRLEHVIPDGSCTVFARFIRFL